ncbi:MFS transporter [Streptomyces sp. NPDC052610]|uniref:MFS transporter n=1 Tax=Streptomyces sp. NPDC052610 TaxID=3154952 RepID=UPI003434BC0C
MFAVSVSQSRTSSLLPALSADLEVGVSRAGLLITAFALGMIIGSPTMAMATLRLPRRRTLVLALVVFSLGHVFAALSTSFTVVLVARVVTALAAGAFWSVGAVVATTAAGPAAATRAIGVMIGGLTLANVVGVPVGSFAGQFVGWRGPFWALAALSALAATLIGRFIPAQGQQTTVSVRAELSALRQGRLWLALSAAMLIMGGVLATYSYITPLLRHRAGRPLGRGRRHAHLRADHLRVQHRHRRRIVARGHGTGLRPRTDGTAPGRYRHRRSHAAPADRPRRPRHSPTARVSARCSGAARSEPAMVDHGGIGALSGRKKAVHRSFGQLKHDRNSVRQATMPTPAGAFNLTRQ